LIAHLKRLLVGTPLEGTARRVYRLVRRRSRAGPHDEQTFAIMRRTLRVDSNCVDVGAHVGSILLEMLRYAPKGTHYAFEPLPALYRRLVSSYPGVRVYELALSDRAGEKTFQHVVTNPAYSGFVRRQYPRANETIEQLTVRTELLDNIIPESLPVDFIKIDVEGAVLEVLRGGLQTIRRNRPTIVFEYGRGAVVNYGTPPELIYEFFEACKLRVFLLHNRPGNAAPLSEGQFSDEVYGGSFYFVAHR